MKILFIGGIKSGKSFYAEKFILQKSKKKPYYLATTEFIDKEMKKKIKLHKKQRKKSFKTLEEGVKLYKSIKKLKRAVLVEDISMWINNMLYHNFEYKTIEREINKIMQLDNDIVFVVNDVSSSVVSQNPLVRDFVNINGKISQIIASNSDEVYQCIAKIATKIK